MISRERTDLLARRIGLPAARSARAAAFPVSASTSRTANGAVETRRRCL
jgi:hypothetical protein